MWRSVRDDSGKGDKGDVRYHDHPGPHVAREAGLSSATELVQLVRTCRASEIIRP